MKIDFANRVVLITGASRGIGRAIALLFAEHGAHVALNYLHNREAIDSLIDELKPFRVQAKVYQADIADEAAVAGMVDKVAADFGRLDVLVNNAGIWKEASITTITDEQLTEMIDINLKGMFYSARAATPYLAKQGGSIINISSTAGQRGEAYHSHYASTKGAALSFTKSLATELVREKIRVNCVAPGWVATDMSSDALSSPDANKYLNEIPMRRPARPEEIAGAVVFLASDWASFITGEVVNVNGGAVLCG
jgi:3-oxoacyl-[acyl-carrier protein] reductase